MSVQPESGGATKGILDTITKGQGRAAQVANRIAFGMLFYEFVRTVTRRARNAATYTVTVQGDDDIYVDVQRWLIDRLPPARRRSLNARSGRTAPSRMGEDEAVPQLNGGARKVGRVFLAYDGSRTQTVDLNGHRVAVNVERERVETRNDWFAEREKITFSCLSQAARDAVVEFLGELAKVKHSDVRSRFYLATRWGDWRRREDIPQRNLDTVILEQGKIERVVDDLTEFLGAEHKYARVGIPWHRGYVFHGPPGTGKTSLAKALAQHFEMDVHYVPLSDLEKDTNLLQLLMGIDARSMLVLEDVDVVHAAKARDDEQANSITMSGLLNALDGFVTPHGLVTVMTTNDLSALDPALIRPGRADRVEELSYLDDSQALRLAALVAGQITGCWPSVEGLELTHAELVEAAKTHLDDPHAAQEAMIGCILDARVAV